MDKLNVLAGCAVAAMFATSVSMADITNETNDQKCARWAGYQNLQGSAQAEYIKDCQLDLRVPEKSGDAGDD